MRHIASRIETNTNSAQTVALQLVALLVNFEQEDADWWGHFWSAHNRPCELDRVAQCGRACEASEAMTLERAWDVLAWCQSLPGWIGGTEPTLRLVPVTECADCGGTGRVLSLECSCRQHSEDCGADAPCWTCDALGFVS